LNRLSIGGAGLISQPGVGGKHCVVFLLGRISESPSCEKQGATENSEMATVVGLDVPRNLPGCSQQNGLKGYSAHSQDSGDILAGFESNQKQDYPGRAKRVFIWRQQCMWGAVAECETIRALYRALAKFWFSEKANHLQMAGSDP